MGDDVPQDCHYAGSAGAGIDAERRVDENMVVCTGDADVVVRIEGQIPARKTPVCREHAKWLRSDDVELPWEQCGEL